MIGNNYGKGNKGSTGRVTSDETKMKLSQRSSGENNAMYGSTFEWYTNGIKNKRCTLENKEILLNQGFYKGKVEPNRSPIPINFVWFTNGIENRKCIEEKKNNLLFLGFYEGFTVKPKSKEHREKSSKIMKGASIQTLQCPYCGKICSLGNAKRWHFDNCRLKNIEDNQ